VQKPFCKFIFQQSSRDFIPGVENAGSKLKVPFYLNDQVKTRGAKE
jgi:hypothetical protein